MDVHILIRNFEVVGPLRQNPSIIKVIMTICDLSSRCVNRTLQAKYRWAMQGNFFPGDVLRFSLVPPCLSTYRFLIGALYRMEVCGKLGREVVRLTDSGPDYDTKETHAFHWQLIHDVEFCSG